MLHDAISRQTPVVWAHHAAGRRPYIGRAPQCLRRLPPIQTHPAKVTTLTMTPSPDAAARHCHSAPHARDAGGPYSAAKAQMFPDIELRRIAPGHCTAAHHCGAAGGTYSRTRLRPERRRATAEATPMHPAPAAAQTPGPSGQEAGQGDSDTQCLTAGFHPFRDAAHGRPAGGHARVATRTGNAACHPNKGARA